MYMAEFATCDWAAAVRHDARSHEIIYLCTLYSICLVFFKSFMLFSVYIFFMLDIPYLVGFGTSSRGLRVLRVKM